MNKMELKAKLRSFQSSMKGFDWRGLQKYTSPQAADDLNDFLEKMPQNTGQTMLIIAGVVWAAAGAVGLFTAVQMQKITELRIELAEAQAVKPIVPQIASQAANSKEVGEFVDESKEIYSGLEMRASGSTVTISAKTTAYFGQFREAIGHVQNGGNGWRVDIDRLCVGRECEKSPLSAVLKINTVSVRKSG